MGPEGKLRKALDRWRCKTYAEKQLVYRKFQSGVYGTCGWPDGDYMRMLGYIFFIELKAPGKDPTPLQEDKIKTLRELGFHVYVCDNLEDAKAAIRKEMRGAI